MFNKKKICVLIVTYNRKDLLKNLLESLLEQTYKIDGIIVVDNNSEDGTNEMLVNMGCIKNAYEKNFLLKSDWKQNINFYYYQNSINVGGAGGFAKAFELVKDLEYDYIWIMDDDVKPDKNCLKELVNNLDDSSRICVPCRKDAIFCDFPMLKVDLKKPFLFRSIKIYTQEIKIPFVYVESMPFEGPLIDKSLINEIGIPDKEYFILHDDTDYAHRALKVTKIKYVVNAKLKRMIAINSYPKWCWRNYYTLRNCIYFEKKYGENFAVRHIRTFLRCICTIFTSIKEGNRYRVKWIIKAYLDGIRGNMGKTYDPKEIPSES